MPTSPIILPVLKKEVELTLPTLPVKGQALTRAKNTRSKLKK